MKQDSKWVKNDKARSEITVVHVDKHGVDFVYDDDKGRRVWWQLKSHFEANFTPAGN